jgi:pimeloyl-ACP methyl ester carboxylesterase
MRKQEFLLFTVVRVLCISILSALLFILRYILKTPQPLESMLPGESHLFKWTHGHIFHKVPGSADASPLVVLHTPEIGGSSYEFRALVEQLAHSYHVYALDLLGFGLSDRPNRDYTGETYTTLCQDFLTQVVLQSAIVVASGVSCTYGIAVASTQPSLCDGLVLLSPHSDRQWQDRIARVLQQPFIGLCVYAFLTTRIVLRAVIARQKQVQEVTESELDYIYASAHQLGAQYAALAFLSGRLLFDVSPYRETLRTPTLLIRGANTSLIDEAIAELCSANDVIQEVLIQGAGLRPHQERTAEVVAQLSRWHRPMMAAHAVKDRVSLTHTSTMNSVCVQREGTRTQDAGVHERETRATGLAGQSYTKEYENRFMKEDTMKDEQVEAYCVKCKEKRMMKNPTDTVTKNGRNAKTGSCPVCGTKLFRFVAN